MFCFVCPLLINNLTISLHPLHRTVTTETDHCIILLYKINKNYDYCALAVVQSMASTSVWMRRWHQAESSTTAKYVVVMDTRFLVYCPPTYAVFCIGLRSTTQLR